jgi:hypothetical protein
MAEEALDAEAQALEEVHMSGSQNNPLPIFNLFPATYLFSAFAPRPSYKKKPLFFTTDFPPFQPLPFQPPHSPLSQLNPTKLSHFQKPSKADFKWR